MATQFKSIVVDLATVENISLIGLQNIDGVITVAEQRVLVKDQANKVLNGVYIASEGIWERSSDTLIPSLIVFVLGGYVNGYGMFYIGNIEVIVPDVSAITFCVFDNSIIGNITSVGLAGAYGVPFYIAEGNSFLVKDEFQLNYKTSIIIDGSILIDGQLTEV